MHIDQTLKTIIENREILVTFILSLIAIIRLTSWGKAQSSALNAVVGVIEGLGATDVKHSVAGTEKGLPEAVKDAIRDSVAKTDPKKTPKNVFVRILREVFRGL